MQNLYYEKYLNNDLFIKKYIIPNIKWHFSYLNGKREFSRVYKVPHATFLKKFFLKSYLKKEFYKERSIYPTLSLY